MERGAAPQRDDGERPAPGGRRRGLQAEILANLSLVMLTATLVLGLVFGAAHRSNADRLQRLAAQALLEDALSPLPTSTLVVPELRWWTLGIDGSFAPRGAHGDEIDADSRALALEARAQGRPLLRTGPPWWPMRFAAPVPGGVSVARLPPAAPAWLLLGVVVGDVAIFTAFGMTLLRGRLVRPLERISAAARGLAAGDLGVRVPADGPREVHELAVAWNEMTESLESRTRALEKAVAELRRSNHELRTARAGLDRAERLAAVGRLAAGVAHEVGNPMGALLAFLDLAGRDPGLTDGSREHLRRAGEEGERVRRILRQLLDFSRPRRLERTPVDLASLAEEMSGLVRAQQRYSGIAITVRRDGNPPEALAERGAVAQILLNLLINAADALGAAEVADPRIDLVVRPGVLSVRDGDDPADARARNRFDAVECSVADNGPGIPTDDRESIFDPFFTTKEAGEGTGLGLSNSLRFAEELGGTLELDAAVRREGATFVLRLPALERRIHPTVRRGRS